MLKQICLQAAYGSYWSEKNWLPEIMSYLAAADKIYVEPVAQIKNELKEPVDFGYEELSSQALIAGYK